MSTLRCAKWDACLAGFDASRCPCVRNAIVLAFSDGFDWMRWGVVSSLQQDYHFGDHGSFKTGTSRGVIVVNA